MNLPCSLVALIAWAITAATAVADFKPATVIAVHDGDTIAVTIHGGDTKRVRLNGIDAPELKQPFGRESRDRLAAAIDGKDVMLDVLPRSDRWGRLVATVYHVGTDECLAQVESGCAWIYRGRYFTVRVNQRPTYLGAELAARAAKLGLWSLESPQAPWEYRRLSKR